MTPSNLREFKGLLHFFYSYISCIGAKIVQKGRLWKVCPMHKFCQLLFWDPFPERNTVFQDEVHISKKFDQSKKCTKGLIYSKLACVVVSTKRAQYWWKPWYACAANSRAFHYRQCQKYKCTNVHYCPKLKCTTKKCILTLENEKSCYNWGIRQHRQMF